MAPLGVILLMIVLVVLVLDMFSADDRPPRPIAVATYEWDPFVGSGLAGYGPMARVVEEAMRRAGYDPLLSITSPQEAQNAAARGDVLGAFPFIEASERKDRFLFSDPLDSFSYVLFYKRAEFRQRQDGKDLQGIDSPEELSGFKVGLIKGYQLWGNLSEQVDVAEEFNNLQEAFGALDRGRVDLLGEGRIVGERFLYSAEARLDATHFAYIKRVGSWLTGSQQDLYLITSKTAEGEGFLRSFNQALKQVKAGPLYSEIVGSLKQEERKTAERAGLVSAPVAAKDPREEQWYLLPRGTRAAIFEWPAAFQEGHPRIPAQSASSWCQIKILNGPQRGRMLSVRANQIELIPYAEDRQGIDRDAAQ